VTEETSFIFLEKKVFVFVLFRKKISKRFARGRSGSLTRVARFLSVPHTKTGEIYQIPSKYTNLL
jgi:hypothetical protein